MREEEPASPSSPTGCTQHPTFAGCTRDDIVALLCAGKRTAIPAQWAFVQEQTPADAAYVLLEGNARVFRNGVPIADLESGDIVGETGLLNGTLRNATVTSLEPLKALRIDQDRFAELLWRRPNVRDAFTSVSRRTARRQLIARQLIAQRRGARTARAASPADRPAARPTRCGWPGGSAGSARSPTCAAPLHSAGGASISRASA